MCAYMDFIKKEQDASGKKEFVYLTKLSSVDRKTLKKIGFKFKDEQIIDDIECEVWIKYI